IVRAVASAGLPAGTFSLVHGGNEIGAALVQHRRIMAVGFTGSRRGGLAISALAAARAVPIPVYAEMSSINPVLLFPQALRQRAEAMGEAFGASLTMGAGQFCTNPGLAFAIGVDDQAYERFRNALAGFVEASAPQPMLTAGIAEAYADGLESLGQVEGVQMLVQGQMADRCAPACVFETDAVTFAQTPALHAENFGASTILVRCSDVAEAAALLAGMEGQLTATLQVEEADLADAAVLLPALERLAGRILVNGFPTGVEVCHAMVHGGPFPATSDSRTTSVGTLAMDRFLRPISYQGFPEMLLPEELHDGNPKGARRRVNGEY
ncbi:MAG TPA: aldehyde dehydrogenase family protein, partial [Hyphomonas sp.]|nr:aldehyde dehydrogenase family protein [Hyphomonas sp.]HRX74304.1 aldehyde dehydrogenase family protein [Hyphomonas sp.]